VSTKKGPKFALVIWNGVNPTIVMVLIPGWDSIGAPATIPGTKLDGSASAVIVKSASKNGLPPKVPLILPPLRVYVATAAWAEFTIRKQPKKKHESNRVIIKTSSKM
jgi:hypothetical protein